MQRRHLLRGAGLGLLPGWALAHHGWSGFDQDRPLWLEGTAQSVSWQNPHAELRLQRAPDMRLPADLATRMLPAQAAPVDGKALAARAQLPRRPDAVWEVELAPLTRMEAWKVPQIRPGTALAVLGFTHKDEAGDAVLRAEYLFLGGQVYGLRSAPV